MQVNSLKTVKLVINVKNHEKFLMFNNNTVLLLGASVSKITGDLEVSSDKSFVYDASKYKNFSPTGEMAQMFNDQFDKKKALCV